MHKVIFKGLVASLALAASIAGTAAETIVSTSTRPGPVDGVNTGSDAFIWRLFVTQIAAPVTPGSPTPAMFETWASDKDIFTKPPNPPHFPSVNEPHKFQRSALGRATFPNSSAGDSPCEAPNDAPNNPLAGGFPTTGPLPCIAEEVKRNRPEYDYIVGNKLYWKDDLEKAFYKGFTVNMPTSSVSVKGDWIPVVTLLQWVPSLGSVAKIKKAYLTANAGNIEYALVSMHISSKQNPKWVWATLEHKNNPGRCDYIGCYDNFGAVDAAVPPNRSRYNTQYGDCQKSDALLALMKRNGLAEVWQNYCLKGSQVDYTGNGDVPTSLANSVTEGINAGISVVAGSCIACHHYAAFGTGGVATPGALGMLNFNPTGNPVPGVLANARRYDFMWGFLNAK